MRGPVVPAKGHTRVYNMLATIFWPFIVVDGMITEDYDLVAVQTLREHILGAKGLGGAIANGGYLSICDEVCPSTKRKHSHIAFFNPPKLKTALSFIHGLPKASGVCDVDPKYMVMDVKFPIKCVHGPKAVRWYIQKGDQPKPEWDEHGSLGDNWSNNLTGYVEHGTYPEPPPPKKTGGARNDITEVINVILGNLDDPPRPTTIQHFFIDPKYAKYQLYAGAHMPHIKLLFNSRTHVKRSLPEAWKWKLWQKDAIALVSTPCDPDKFWFAPDGRRIQDDRCIHWFYDQCGGAGKSVLTKFLITNHEAISLSGKSADCKYGYANSKQGTCIFDIPRSMDQEFLSWDAIEKIKDGAFFSPKYESSQFVRDAPQHVLVFSNSPPPEGKVTKDRINLIVLTEADNDLGNTAPADFDTSMQF